MKERDRDRFEADFRDHHARTYGEAGRPYDDYRHAYDYGRRMALSAEAAGESYESARERLRGDYAVHGHGPDYDAVERAVRFGFERTRELRLHQTRAMDNAHNQFRRGDDEPTNSLEDTAAAMTVAPPENDDRR